MPNARTPTQPKAERQAQNEGRGRHQGAAGKPRAPADTSRAQLMRIADEQRKMHEHSYSKIDIYKVASEIITEFDQDKCLNGRKIRTIASSLKIIIEDCVALKAQLDDLSSPRHTIRNLSMVSRLAKELLLALGYPDISNDEERLVVIAAARSNWRSKVLNDLANKANRIVRNESATALSRHNTKTALSTIRGLEIVDLHDALTSVPKELLALKFSADLATLARRPDGARRRSLPLEQLILGLSNIYPKLISGSHPTKGHSVFRQDRNFRRLVLIVANKVGIRPQSDQALEKFIERTLPAVSRSKGKINKGQRRKSSSSRKTDRR